MAITWEVTPSFLNKERTRASIIAVATDDVDPENPVIVSAIKDALVDTVANKKALWLNIKKHYDNQVLAEAEETIAIAALASEAKIGLEEL